MVRPARNRDSSSTDLGAYICSAIPLQSGTSRFLLFFFFNDPAPTEIYTLSLHDALPICPAPARRDPRAGADLRAPGQTPAGLGRLARGGRVRPRRPPRPARDAGQRRQDADEARGDDVGLRSEEHTSELQSPDHLVCRLLL